VRDSQEHSALVTVHEAGGKWQALGPLIKRKRLFRSEQGEAFLYRLAPGARVPAHPHASDEECVLIEGEVMVGDLFMRRGDFQLAPKGLPHTEIHTETGALLYIRTGVG